ncbi:MAG: hypothetical protein V7K48_34020 [Nostoc sp.]|uniref:hypothetical protein n=1 Tax=Nostoc sp. TaxID=1180 RepID=UPI002FF7E58B
MDYLLQQEMQEICKKLGPGPKQSSFIQYIEEIQYRNYRSRHNPDEAFSNAMENDRCKACKKGTKQELINRIDNFIALLINNS